MRRTLKYISGLLLLQILPGNPISGRELGNPACGTPEARNAEAFLQEEPVSDEGSQETVLRTRGPRIGYDIGNLALLYFEPERMIFTASVDYEVAQDIYPVVELGYQNVRIRKENYDYVSNGIFVRPGVDVNFLKYEENDVYEMLFAGLRYGFSSMNHRAEDIRVEEEYFGGLASGNIPGKQIRTHWISLAGGARAEVFRNFFMGWSVYANLKIAQTKDDRMAPYNIPGFGRGDRRAGLVITYTLSYRFPVQRYKPVKIIKSRKPEENP